MKWFQLYSFSFEKVKKPLILLKSKAFLCFLKLLFIFAEGKRIKFLATALRDICSKMEEKPT
jgi:hypothetical protein